MEPLPLQQYMFINVYKCLYNFDLGDINVWMLDSINVCMLDLFEMLAYICRPTKHFLISLDMCGNVYRCKSGTFDHLQCKLSSTIGQRILWD